MTILTMTTAASRKAAAATLAAKLAEADPAAVVTIEYEREMHEREVTVTVRQGDVRSWCDLSGDSTWGTMVHWYVHGQNGPRFADRFAAMIGGSINTSHRMKATGPFGDQGPKRGLLDADDFECLCETWAEAVRAVADGDDGGAFLAEQA